MLNFSLGKIFFVLRLGELLGNLIEVAQNGFKNLLDTIDFRF